MPVQKSTPTTGSFDEIFNMFSAVINNTEPTVTHHFHQCEDEYDSCKGEPFFEFKTAKVCLGIGPEPDRIAGYLKDLTEKSTFTRLEEIFDQDFLGKIYGAANKRHKDFEKINKEKQRKHLEVYKLLDKMLTEARRTL